MENVFNIQTIIMLILGSLLFLSLVAFHKRLTMPAGIIILCVNLIFDVLLVFTGMHLLWLIFPLVLLIWFCIYKFYFNSLDFNRRILSFSLDKNKIKDGRIIGTCFPYYKKQLKFNNSKIVQSSTALKGGCLCTGSSGSGKTFLIKNLIKQDIKSSKRVVFINFKGDRDTTDDIEKNTPDNVPIYKLSFEECNFSYDPLINLDDSGRVEAILNMRAWSMDGADAHYKTGVQLFLQKSLRDFKYSKGNFLREYYEFLKTYNVRREDYDSYNTVLKLLELTLTSDVGGKIFSEENKFDFNQDGQYVVLVNFTSAQKTLGTAITSLMFRDLLEVGTKNPYSPELCLYVDEYGSCETPLAVKDILEKGRSCQICTLVSMQDLNQLIISTSAPFLDSVLGTVNSYIVFAGATRSTAEKLAGTQIYEIDDLLMSLRKPVDGRPPTAMYISKYPVFEKGGTEVYRFTPYNEVINKETKDRQNYEEISNFQENLNKETKDRQNYEEIKTINVNDIDSFL